MVVSRWLRNRCRRDIRLDIVMREVDDDELAAPVGCTGFVGQPTNNMAYLLSMY